MGNTFRQTMSNIFSDKRMDQSTMLSSHICNTIQRAQQCNGNFLIASQDTSYLNFHGHQHMEGLGFIQGNLKGIIQHNLLLTSEAKIPLGLLHQQHWTRNGGLPFDGEKESEKWINGLKQVNDLSKKVDKSIVLVQDREADYYDFFTAERAKNVELIVRLFQPRSYQLGTVNGTKRLSELHDVLPPFKHKQVCVQRKNKQVILNLSLKAGRVQAVCAKKGKSEFLSVVIAEEIGCVDADTGTDLYNNEDRSTWYLLSSLPIETQEDVERIVDFYSMRWMIERLHYLEKSGGLSVEKLQFNDIKTMVNALTFYSIVAWKLMSLNYLSRYKPDLDAKEFFGEQEIVLLESHQRKEIRTIYEGTLALGKLVGFVPTKKQPLPGMKIMTEALERFTYVKIGAGLTAFTKPLQD